MREDELLIMGTIVDRRDENQRRLAAASDPSEQRRLKVAIQRDDALINGQESKRAAAAKYREARASALPLEERRAQLKQVLKSKTDELVDLQERFQVEVGSVANAALESQVLGIQSEAPSNYPMRLQDEIRLAQAVVNAGSLRLAEIEAAMAGAKEASKAAEREWVCACADVAEFELMEATLLFMPALASYKSAMRMAGRSYSPNHDIRVEESAIDEARAMLLAEVGQ